MAPRRRIVQAAAFPSSFRALECPNARWMVQELVGLLAAHPQCAPALDGSAYRVLHTNEYGAFPALRLFYRFDDEAVYLLDVEVYDPLAADGGVSPSALT
jgi:hypothetical protein